MPPLPIGRSSRYATSLVLRGSPNKDIWAFSLSPFNRGFDVDVEQMEEEAPTISRLVRSV